MEKLRDDCPLCTDPIGERPILKEGTLLVPRETEPISWVVIPSKPSSVDTGEHLIFTAISHHVGSGDKEARRFLMQVCLNLGWELLGENFQMVLNQGPKASSFEHFHAHLRTPGPEERLVSVVINVPAVLDELTSNGTITTGAAEAIKERILQRAR